jgi:hypothetical protein
VAAAVETAAPAVADRLQGRRPSRVKALLAATAVGVSAAVLTYRLLRRPVADQTDEG